MMGPGMAGRGSSASGGGGAYEIIGFFEESDRGMALDPEADVVFAAADSEKTPERKPNDPPELKSSAQRPPARGSVTRK